tara:strand:+ start:284 stop:577 length:294 start_codon:yes stop_codon:yes gene_type:complete
MDDYKRLEIEAATFRRLVKHLDAHKEVQNIDLMNLASFCRNCLSKWYRAEAEERGVELDYEDAREAVYGMPYGTWKETFQTEATQAQIDIFKGGREE